MTIFVASCLMSKTTPAISVGGTEGGARMINSPEKPAPVEEGPEEGLLKKPTKKFGNQYFLEVVIIEEN